MTGWSNTPKPHWYNFGGYTYREQGHAIIHTEVCRICRETKTSHDDPIPPEVELQRQGAPRLEGF